MALAETVDNGSLLLRTVLMDEFHYCGRSMSGLSAVRLYIMLLAVVIQARIGGGRCPVISGCNLTQAVVMSYGLPSDQHSVISSRSLAQSVSY